MNKKIELDETTVQIMKRVLASPPKPHDEMKVGRQKKRRTARGRAASAKRHNASRTDRES